uniref:Rho GTPase activating protein 17b n=1 Tax=Oryzias sinensis TaxID=183150 RepID=A0A8C7YEA1_9TELE
MELVRLASHSVHKRLVSCMQGGVGIEAERRHKKLPLMALSQAMLDGGSSLGDDGLIGKMMELCGDKEKLLANELVQHEVQIEKEILDPLNQLAEEEIPNILKQRKQLAKLVLDYDSAKARYKAAKSNNSQAMAGKLEPLKDEMDEALNKVEICKDQLSADLYNFASKEGDYARYFVMLLEAQADYHRKSLAALEAAMPDIQKKQDSLTEKPAYGTALEEHLKRTNRDIALPIEACVMMLLETGMKEEGLFRIAAGASKLKKLKAALDCSTSQLEEFYCDPHAVAGALKSYLRELPEPLMTFGLYEEWVQASSFTDSDKRLQSLWTTCSRMPENHKANFRYLVKFLARLAQDSDVNKMTPSNIAIVLGPNLLWSKTEGTLAEMAAATSVHVVSIIEPIIQHADWFFPEEVNFNVTGMFNKSSHPATPDPEPNLDRKRPGSMGQDGDSHAPRKDRYLSRPNLSLPLSLSSRPKTVSRQESRGLAVSAFYLVADESITVTETPTEDLPCPDFKAAPYLTREFTTTPPMQRNGSAHLVVGMSGSKGPSPHMARRASQSTNTQIPSSPHPTTPRRNLSKDAIQAPSHPPPQPPPVHQPQEDPEPSPPSSPMPSDTLPHDGSLPSYPSGSLPRPSRPAPKPRMRPSMPPPPQPPGNETGNGVCSSSSKIITGTPLFLQSYSRVTLVLS